MCKIVMPLIADQSMIGIFINIKTKKDHEKTKNLTRNARAGGLDGIG